MDASIPLTYPDRLIPLPDGSSLYMPDPALVKSIYEELLKTDAATAFPFWAKIWPSAQALTAFLQTERQWTEGKNVIEIGAGLGLPSFTIAHLTATLIISDHAPEAVRLLEKNIRYRKLEQAKACCLDWNQFPEDLNADTVLLSDINYSPEEFGALLQLIHKLLDKGADIILATPQRLIANKFVDALQPFIVRTEHTMVEDAGSRTAISILILSR